MRVLVVDDEREFAEVLTELLRDDGHTVQIAFNGRQALALIASAPAPPDLVLCDVMLPGLSGEALVADLRQRFPWHYLPVVLMSASADPRVPLRDVWFLSKPIDFGELLGLVDRVREPANVSAA